MSLQKASIFLNAEICSSVGDSKIEVIFKARTMLSMDGIWDAVLCSLYSDWCVHCAAVLSRPY